MTSANTGRLGETLVASTKPDLVFEKCSVRFLYNFVLDFLNLPFDANPEVETGAGEQPKSRAMPDSVVSLLRKQFGGKGDVKDGNLDGRNGIEGVFRSRFPSKLAVTIRRDVTAMLEIDGGEARSKVELSVQAIVNDCGTGLCDVRISTIQGERATLKQVHDILSLANEIPGRQNKLIIEGCGISIFGVFVRTMCELLEPFKDTKGQLVEWSRLWHELQNESQGFYRIEWLDYQLAGLDSDTEYQQPYPVLDLSLKSELYNEVFLARAGLSHKDIHGRRAVHAKEIASLLLREIIYENIEFIDSTFPAWHNLGLTGIALTTNLNLNSQLFLSLHFRSCLIIRNAGLPEERDPAPHIVPGILAMVDTTRSRWYVLLVVNGLLDLLLRGLTHEKQYTRALIDGVLRRRIKLGGALEDPLVYQWGGGSTPEAYAAARRAFTLERLEESALHKLGILDRCLADIARIQDVTALLAEIRRQQQAEVQNAEQTPSGDKR